MKMLLDFPTIGEPHYAQALPASLIQDKQLKFYKLAENTNPYVTKAESEGGITRNGKRVDIKMIAIRCHFAPDNLEGVQVGDTVYFHVTNIEQDWDIVHGFAVLGAENAELIMAPGETRTLKWIPKATGVYPFYCTDFCSALHQEMQGYVRVSPAGSNVPLMANMSRKAQAQIGERRQRNQKDDSHVRHEAARQGTVRHHDQALQTPRGCGSAAARAPVRAAALARAARGAPVPRGAGDAHPHRARCAARPRHDLDNINELNHYIGMKPIEPDAIPELRLDAVDRRRARGGRACSSPRLGRRARALRVARRRSPRSASPALVDFWRWEYDYGHNLDPRRDHQDAGHDLPAAAHRREAAAQLHGDVVAGRRWHACRRSPSRSAWWHVVLHRRPRSSAERRCSRAVGVLALLMLGSCAAHQRSAGRSDVSPHGPVRTITEAVRARARGGRSS